MTNKQKVTREKGDATREKIILSARGLFLEHGFAAASMSMIAKQASVNRSLIFHHFSNKGDLWQVVKQQLLQEQGLFIEEGLDQAGESLSALLHFFIDVRFDLYQRSPDVFKLACWQIVDKHSHDLNAPQQETMDKAKLVIEKMQKQGLINASINAQVILTSLLGVAYGPMLLQYKLPLTEKQKESYLQLMKQMLETMLKPN